MQYEPVEKERDSWLFRVVGALTVLVLLAGVAWVARQMLDKDKPRKPQAQQIAVLRQQPPPPPPKPPEKPPEPPRVKEEVKVEQPKPPTPEPEAPKPAAAPERPLGLDSDGASGQDGFGLAANRGGRDITTIGGASSAAGGSGPLGRYFTGLLQRNFFEALSRSRKLPLEEFNVTVRLWLGDDGRVQRAQIVNGSGNPELDQLITTTLAEMAPLREVPPASLRQVQLRLNRRS